MVRLREISRTAVFAWWSGAGAPLVVTGTRAGAVDDSQSGDIKLELWDLGLDKTDQTAELEPAGSITSEAAFNDIAWSEPDDEHPLGVIAGALDDGSVVLWDAQKLRRGDSDALISKTTKHSGSAKALQWNPHRHNLLASVGVKGEIFIYDLNNMANPFRLGGTAARADDIECLDWNKQEKTAHILATGSSGGFVTVWDVKQKRDILTLNNLGRKAVSAVAWDPEESTKLATASGNDLSPSVMLWNLRQSSAPERELKGHEVGVLGLSWCQQDPDLLLSAGKDHRTFCWNPKTGEKYAEFAAGYWAFQAKWNPHNPSLIASASLDGKITILSIQNVNAQKEEQTNSSQAASGEDFFSQVQTQPQSVSFNVPKAPKWLARPASVAFGFGGRLVKVSSDTSRKSTITIETFAVDKAIGEATTKFEQQLQSGDIAGICAAKISDASTDEEKADWQVIETLNTGKSRKLLRQHLGFKDSVKENATGTDDVSADDKPKEENAEDDFFGSSGDGDNFLSNLAATKGVKTNNPFNIHTESQSAADREITCALLLGEFETALDVCLKEERISDAFMIAVCGGQKCIDKAQAAYLKSQANGPQYVRLLASIVGKNLWDVVHNADLGDWKEVVATLCTYADENEFSDLCEVLGDRLEEAYQQGHSTSTLRKDASFCYLAGSKLEKVVNNWVQELQEQEQASLAQSVDQNDFSVHAKCLQDFMEKVTVFRKVTNFQDSELQAVEDWKLASLYKLYEEYAEILAAHGQIAIAEQYLSLLPPKFGGAESAQQRVKSAAVKGAARVQKPAAALPNRPAQQTQPLAQPFQPTQPLVNQARNAPSPYAPSGISAQSQPAANPYAPASNPYAPTGYQPTQAAGPYGQPSQYGGYRPPSQQSTAPPAARTGPPPPAIQSMTTAKPATDWNDLPDNFLDKRPANSRRGTPGPQSVGAPYYPSANPLSTPPVASPYGFQKPVPAALPPPPKVGETSPMITSPPISSPPPPRTSSSLGGAYTPQPSQTLGSTLPPPSAPPPLARGASPYQPPPSTSTAAPSSRYAPAPGTSSTPVPGMVPGQRNVAPNPYQAQPSPYAPQQSQPQTPYGQPPQAQTPYGQPPQAQAPPPRAGPRPQGPPRGGPPQGPPQQTGPPPTQFSSPPPPPMASSQGPPPATRQKHPRGDRSHIPAEAQPIVDLLTPEIARIKAMAPQSFKAQVEDMEKRINLLFDHLNNQDLLQPDTVQQMVQVAQHVHNKEWDQAQALFTEMSTTKATEGTNWMVSHLSTRRLLRAM
jgi:protein transport protein SEC31